MKNQPIAIECNCSPLVPNSHASDCPTYLAIVASVRELAECDHEFLESSRVARITEPFGFLGRTYFAQANPQDFKGLSLWDDNGDPMDRAWGQNAHSVAEQICVHLGIDYPPMHGIGSQLRVCVDAIKKFYGITE